LGISLPRLLGGRAMRRTLMFISALLIAGCAARDGTVTPFNTRNNGGFGGGGGSGGVVTAVCPPVTAAWCTDRNSPNNGRCWDQGKSQCAQLVADAFKQNYNNLTSGTAAPGDAPHGTFSSV